MVMKTAKMQAVLITGASSGIGFALAEHYLAQGMQVIACGRNREALQNISGATPLEFDITDNAQVQTAATELKRLLLDNHWQLQHVILNAGSCEYIDDVLHFDSALFARVINTNVIAMGYCLEHFLPLLSSGAQLGLMSSSATYLPFPRAEAYGASKAAISYLGRSLRVDLAEHDIGVSVICPGFVKTPLTDKNDFAMPMQITAQQAAVAIYNGMHRQRNEIHFPGKFTWLLKLASLLPESLLVSLLAKKNN
ncbi:MULTISPECIES: SDR family NAD(P)-dependent oxidoreductase [Shewanella]|jgi:NAD(P)-dependent dehydrogenase (short-subunit alcohol dehydrogenase family)|uniref:SDR family NAD(P)-dependent oxidoreductase n=1 Tax=Shewanella metallivivens TaxID=2872342 RepID=A0ABT5TMH5_9GAMM|nr:SDR family NAD(P)-dependent oxidoreductase [Shewanella metallivivens]MDD8059814.1 SDR family NAD(P)-dependent oxidoreductase [Shewanella metallivivens]